MALQAPFPSSAHLARFVKELKDGVGHVHGDKKIRNIVFLQGEHTLNRHDTDRELPFHQEANFHYLTGCLVPSSTFIIDIPSDFTSAIAHNPPRKLFIPKEDPEESLWSVPPPCREVAAAQCGFQVEEVGHSRGVDDESYLSGLLRNTGGNTATLVHVLSLNPLDPLNPLPASWFTSLQQSDLASHIIFTSDFFQTALHRARLIKTPQEIEYIREACRVTSAAHEVVMRELGKFSQKRSRSNDEVVKGKGKGDGKGERNALLGLSEWEIESEADAEAVFVACCRRFGCGQAYLPIVASGSRASTLHYVCNDRLFPSTTNTSTTASSGSFSTTALTHDAAPPVATTNGHSHSSTSTGRGCCGDGPTEAFNDLHDGAFLPQVLLIDAGCEYRGGYASDVTRTIPVGNGGKFTEEGREIYEIVLKMQKAAEAQCKPGVHWDDLHLLTHRILCEEFLRLGIFKDATVDELMKLGLSQAFYPHGLGHSLGLDVHDSRQFLRREHLSLPPTSISHPHFFKYLRIRRPLLPNMVLTIEPGCYFSLQLMDEYGVRKSDKVDLGVLYRFVPVGGVRIEDVVVVREGEGVCENLTTVGREREWVEGVCSGRL